VQAARGGDAAANHLALPGARLVAKTGFSPSRRGRMQNYFSAAVDFRGGGLRLARFTVMERGRFAPAHRCRSHRSVWTVQTPEFSRLRKIIAVRKNFDEIGLLLRAYVIIFLSNITFQGVKRED